MRGLRLVSGVALALGVLAPTAFANTEYQFTWNPALGGNNNAAGTFQVVKGSFNTVTNVFSWEATFKPNAGVLPNGFWLAVSPGPNPKGHAGELATYYFDASGSNPKLWAYAYNGFSGGDSYKDGSPASGVQAPDKIYSSLKDPNKILNFTNRMNADGSKTLGFTMNASVIQSHNPKYPGNTPWTGTAFGSKIGVWFSVFSGLQTQTGSDGYLTDFKYQKHGWLDAANYNAQLVPEPATMTALGLGVLALLRRKKGRASA